jgi:replicative DNA helicase
MARTTEVLGDPKNIEAEKNVLGCAIMSKQALEKVCNILTEDMFYDKNNAVIFKAVSDLQKDNKVIDAVTLKNEIEKSTPISEIGGVPYLGEVIQSVVSASNVDAYIDIVKDKALRRNLIKACENIENVARKEEFGTADAIDAAEKQIFSITKQRKAGDFKLASDVVQDAVKKLEDLSKNGSDVTGIATGFVDFDKLTGGLQPNQLIIIAARPAMGKTAFALNLAVHAALSSGKSVGLFNLEMGADQLMTRMFAAEGAIEANKLRTGQLNNDDWKKVNEAASVLSSAPIYFEDATNITISEIRAKCRRLAEQHNLGLVIIDYLQLITGGPGYGSNRQQEVSDISRSLKTMAMELEIPVIALAQLSRQVEGREDKRPMLSDLRESGSIEQDADIVSFLYRDDYYNKKTETETSSISLSELIVAKHRQGSTANIKLVFERNISKFRNYDKRNDNNNEEN